MTFGNSLIGIFKDKCVHVRKENLHNSNVSYLLYNTIASIQFLLNLIFKKNIILNFYSHSK
jgi:hypothetical protein